MPKWKVRTFGCSLPKPLLEKLDTVRGDVNRSRYLQRLVEKNINTIAQIHPKVWAPEGNVLPLSKGVNPNG